MLQYFLNILLGLAEDELGINAMKYNMKEEAVATSWCGPWSNILYSAEKKNNNYVGKEKKKNQKCCGVHRGLLFLLNIIILGFCCSFYSVSYNTNLWNIIIFLYYNFLNGCVEKRKKKKELN